MKNWRWWRRWARRNGAAILKHRLGFFRPVDVATPRSTIAYGDSITKGHSRPSLHLLARDSYVDILAHEDVIAYVGNRGIAGLPTSTLFERAPDNIPHGIARVILLAGTNDVRRRPDVDTMTNLEALRQFIVDRGAQPVIGLLPPQDERPDQVRAMNDRIRVWAARHPEVVMVDHWTALAGPDGRFRPGLSNDGVHPTPAGARRMAAATRSVLEGLS